MSFRNLLQLVGMKSVLSLMLFLHLVRRLRKNNELQTIIGLKI